MHPALHMGKGGKGNHIGSGRIPFSNGQPPTSPMAGAMLPEFQWVSWLVPTFALLNVTIFVYSLYINDCPASHQLLLQQQEQGRHGQETIASHFAIKNIVGDGKQVEDCVFPSLGRFAFEPLSINPLFGPSTQTLDVMGALDYNKVVKGEQGWRLFTCIWLHAGVVHLLANMFSLLFVGVCMEREFGFVKIGALYIISGIGGSMASCFSIQSNISVGASGALFGFLGAMLSELLTNWTIYANKLAALLTLGVVIGINLAMGLVPHVDSSAHIGGFITGFLLGFVLLVRPQYGYISRRNLPHGYNADLIKPKHKFYQYLLWITASLLLITWFVGGMFKLYSGVRLRHGP